jgi:choline dehydrogenase-like flavoprotein
LHLVVGASVPRLVAKRRSGGLNAAIQGSARTRTVARRSLRVSSPARRRARCAARSYNPRAVLDDASAVPAGAELTADLCIVGGGAAGITLARELGPRGFDVCLLEAGGSEHEGASQELYRGEEHCELLGPDAYYLLAGRERALGGTTLHWHGWCRPMDALDFEPRPWVERSGWPMARVELEPFYRRATRALGLRDFDDAADRARPPAPPVLAASERFETTFYHLRAIRFGRVFRRELAASARIRTLLHATAVELEVDPAARRVERVVVAGRGGHRFTVRAPRVVLAAGGIENPRLLLLSDRVAPGGIGNGHDLVGRCFMEHLHGFVVMAALTEPATSLALYRRQRDRGRGGGIAGALRLTARAQSEGKLLNTLLSAVEEPMGSMPAATAAGGALALAVDALGGEARRLSWGRLEIRGEQSPNPASRVTLTAERDRLGCRRVRLDWKVREQDLASLRRTAELLGRDFGATGLGRVRCLLPGEGLPPPGQLYGGFHQMGTTRMHDDPRHGVVDARLRVHGMENLYLAGASVFPTVGCSNPTLTLVALTLRLGDHLAETRP